MYQGLRRAADRLCDAITALCALILAVMVVVIAMLVFTRNFLGFSFSWSEELTRYLLVWLTMLGSAVLLHRGEHIRMDLFAGRLPRIPDALLSLLLRLLVLGFLVILVQQSWLTVQARSVARSPALGLSMGLPYLALPVAGAVMLFVTLVALWGDLRRLAGQDP